MLDFEPSTVSAVKSVGIPTNCIKWLFFRFCQYFLGRVHDIGLAVKYRENSEFALNIKMLNALAYVAAEFVIVTFEKLGETELYAESEEMLTSLCDNFEKTSG